MTAKLARILYIHGFNSSPDSQKAQSFLRYCRENAPRLSLDVPALSHDPARAVEQLEAVVAGGNVPLKLIVGSSLGGYYATWLAEKYTVKAALINPAVSPYRTLGAEFLGAHENMYTGEEYEMTMAHARALEMIEVEPVRRPENFLLLVQTGDEVLDYRLAVQKYAGSEQIVQEGGNHDFTGFDTMIPRILRFAGLPPEQN